MTGFATYSEAVEIFCPDAVHAGSGGMYFAVSLTMPGGLQLHPFDSAERIPGFDGFNLTGLTPTKDSGQTA